MYYAYLQHKLMGVCLFCLLMIWHSETVAEGAPAQKRIMGWVEHIHLLPMNTTVNAKLDSGALTSSLHAEKISHFKRDGEDWVRFEYRNPHRKKHQGKADKPVRVYQIERPVVRTTLIKRHQLSSTQRTVITLPIRLGDQTYEPEFTLTNRSNFIYPVLLGRRFLRQTALVDSSQTHLQPLLIPDTQTSDPDGPIEKTSEESEENE